MNERASYYSGSSAEMKQCAGMLGAVERRHPALVKTALPGEVRNHGGQERIEIISVQLRKWVLTCAHLKSVLA
jgi:hypothetical protein